MCASVEEMNKCFVEEFTQYILNKDPSQNFLRIDIYEAISALSETIKNLSELSYSNWKFHEKRRSQSLLEGSFDIICNFGHKIETLTSDEKQKIWNLINELDRLNNHMLNVCRISDFKSPLSAMKIPARKNSQTVNNSVNHEPNIAHISNNHLKNDHERSIAHHKQNQNNHERNFAQQQQHLAQHMTNWCSNAITNTQSINHQINHEPNIAQSPDKFFFK